VFATGSWNRLGAKLLISNALFTELAVRGVRKVAILAFLLFTVAALVAVGVIVSTIMPYHARIVCLLTHGTQSRVGALPSLPARESRRATPRLTASPAHLRAVA
jgi:hypothetical protein